MVSANQANKAQQEINNGNRAHQKAMWDVTNAYNTPLAQRQRLEAGGLNPNLVYGSGQIANTAQNQNLPDSIAPPVADMGRIFNDGINQYTSNSATEKQMAKTDSDIALQGISGGKMAMETAKTAFELQKAKELKDTAISTAKSSLSGINLRNAEQQIKNLTIGAQNQATLLETYSRIDANKANMTNTQIDTELKRLQLQLRQKGIEVNDGVLFRIFSPLYDNIKDHFKKSNENAEKIYNSGKKMFKNYMENRVKSNK